MGTQSDQIAAHIEQEREQLTQDIRQLETQVREEPKRFFRENAWQILGIAFAACFVIGFLSTRSRS